MPALDSLMGGGATHISDQNSVSPIKTLCGQALDKETTRYFVERTNFEHVTCKVCRGIYFGEKWTGEARSEPEKPVEADPPIESNLNKGPIGLFAHLTKPVNTHQPDLLDRNSQTIGENQDGP